MRHQTKPKQTATVQLKIRVNRNKKQLLKYYTHPVILLSQRVTYWFTAQLFTGSDLMQRLSSVYKGTIHAFITPEDRQKRHQLPSCWGGNTAVQDRNYVITQVGIYGHKHHKKHYTKAYLVTEVWRDKWNVPAKNCPLLSSMIQTNETR
jgi:hypothetical protein